MVRLLAIVCSALLCAVRSARADSPAEFRQALTAGIHYSLSGQFVVHDRPASGEYEPNLRDISTNLARLDPSLLPVSCERIKRAFLNQLGARDEWRGRIHLDLHRFRGADEEILVVPIFITGKWDYRLELPDRVERSRLVMAVVNVLLLEMANRQSDRCAELPAWLAQGLSQEVLLSSKLDLVVEAPLHSENGIALNRLKLDFGIEPAKPQEDSSGNARRVRAYLHQVDPLAEAHDDFKVTPPLSLEQLSWPGEGQFEGDAGVAYRSSAQLLVHGLLQLKDGRAAMQAMIGELPRHLNWQLSFLDAFHADFASQLDWEKWWELRLVQFTGRDLAQTWPDEESWWKLDEIIRPPVEVRTSADELPLHTQVTLQAIIKDWELGRQNEVLQEKARQLVMLRLRVSPELAGLVEDYQRTLETYLQRRNNEIIVPMGKSAFDSQFDLVARDAIKQLNALEARRQELRPKPLLSQPVAAIPKS